MHMPFQKGRIKTGGRIRGTPNKIFESLELKLDKYGFDPIAKLAEIFPNLQPAEQANVCLKVMNFIYPIRKAIEAEISPKHDEELNNEIEAKGTALLSLQKGVF